MSLPASRVSWAVWSQRTLSVLRIVFAFLYLLHGTLKLFGFPAVPEAPPTRPETYSLYWFAGVIESFGGSLLMVGLLTRPVAVVAAIEMAVAYFKVHAPMAPLPIQNHGELAAIFCLFWFYIFVTGPGPWSIDALLRRKPRGTAGYSVKG